MIHRQPRLERFGDLQHRTPRNRFDREPFVFLEASLERHRRLVRQIIGGVAVQPDGGVLGVLPAVGPERVASIDQVVQIEFRMQDRRELTVGIVSADEVEVGSTNEPAQRTIPR